MKADSFKDKVRHCQERTLSAKETCKYHTVLAADLWSRRSSCFYLEWALLSPMFACAATKPGVLYNDLVISRSARSRRT